MPSITLTFRDEDALRSWLDEKIVERMGDRLVEFRKRHRRDGEPWTAEEDAFLVRQQVTTHSTEWMAKYLGRTTNTVGVRICMLRKMLTPGVMHYRRQRAGKRISIPMKGGEKI